MGRKIKANLWWVGALVVCAVIFRLWRPVPAAPPPSPRLTILGIYPGQPKAEALERLKPYHPIEREDTYCIECADHGFSADVVNASIYQVTGRIVEFDGKPLYKLGVEITDKNFTAIAHQIEEGLASALGPPDSQGYGKNAADIEYARVLGSGTGIRVIVEQDHMYATLFRATAKK